MIKRILRGVALVAVFVVAVVAISYLTNSQEEDLTTQMSQATFPVVHLEAEGEEINTLFGHKNEMQARYMQEVITPAATDGSLPFVIDTYGNTIEDVSFKLMRSDGSFYTSGQNVADLTEKDGKISGVFEMDDALEDGREYILHITVDTKQQNNISYYTRVVQKEDLRTEHFVSYARSFSEKTFDKEEAESIRAKLEVSENGSNSSFSYANIHSTFEHITWDKLAPELVSDMDINLLEIDGSTASVLVSYQIATEEEDVSYYNVTDFYRLSYGSETVTYVLNFERHVGQIFDPEQQVITSNGVTLGITDSDVEYISDETGSMVAFEQEGTLYFYSKTDDQISEVFTYTGDDKNDVRNTYRNYEISLIDMDEDGNTKFIVYGYMNRGNHEGETGVVVYYYDVEKNSVEEKIFIPTTKSADVLIDDVEQLAYINEDNLFYLYFNQNIYEIDLDARSQEILCEGLSREQFVTSDDHRYLARQDSDDLYTATELQWKDLSNGKEQTFTVGNFERIRPLGFVNEDLVYGIAREEDISYGTAGEVVFPMYNVKIQEPNGTTPKDRQQSDGVYVTEIEILEDMIRLLRVKKSGDTYQDASPDSLTSNVEAEEQKVELSGYTTDKRKREYRLSFETTIKETDPIRRQPSQVAFEISRDMMLGEEVSEEQIYYVYGLGEFQGGYESAARAIEAADEVRGSVISSHGTVIWRRGGSESATIDGTEAIKAGENYSAMAACLDSIFALEDKKVDTQELLDEGNTAAEILAGQLNTQAVVLSGISMDENGSNYALQMVSQGSPVIAMTGADAPVLIIGYDSVNLTVMDPASGEVKKMGRNDSKALFESAGNIYLTYE